MLRKLTDRIYYMTQEPETDRPLIGLIVGDEYSLVIDSGSSPKHVKEFLKLVQDIKHTPLKYAVLTHWHTDHIFGIDTLKLTTIANYKTEEKLKELRNQNWNDSSLEEKVKDGIFSRFLVDCIKKEMPTERERVIGKCDITFKNSISICLGGITCILNNIGGTHTEDSTVVYIPEEKVLFLGDAIYGKKYNGVFGYTRETLYPMVENIKEYDADYWIASHEDCELRKDTEAILDKLVSVSEIVGDRHDMNEIVMDYIQKNGQEPNEEEKEYIDLFAKVNKVKYQIDKF